MMLSLHTRRAHPYFADVHWHVQVTNTALDLASGEAPFSLPCSPSGPFVGLAFKLEEGESCTSGCISMPQ